MADVQITADLSDLQRLQTLLGSDLPKATQNYANVFNQEFNKNLTNVRKQIILSQRLENQQKSQFNSSLSAVRQQIAFSERLNRQKEIELGLNQAATKGMSRFGVATQQAGYQVGDFLVQVQSGTNWMVAFGQQATQLVGILPMFNSFLGVSGTALVALSAGLGIAIPLATAIGAAFMRTRKETEEADKSFNNLSSSITKLNNFSTELVDKNNKVEESFRNILNVVLEVEKKAVEQDLAAIIQPFEDAITSFEKRYSTFRRLGGQEGGLFEPQLDVLGFDQIEQAAQAYSLLKNVSGETKEELAESLRLTELWLRGSGLLTDEVKELLAQYADAIGVIDVAVTETEKLTASNKENLQTIQQETEVLRAKLQFGSDSLEVLRLTNSQEVENLRVQLEQEAAAEGLLSEQRDIIDAVVQALVEQNKVEEALWSSEAAAKGLEDALRRAASAMASLAGFGASVDKAIEVTTAKVNALKAGADEAIAGRIAGMRVDLEAKRQEALAAPGADPISVVADAAITEASINQLENLLGVEKKLLDQRREASKASSKKAGGIGGTSGLGSDAFSFITDILGTDDMEAQLAEVDIWYDEALVRLATFNEKELELLEQHGVNKAAVEEEYQRRIDEIQKTERQAKIDGYQSMFSDLSTLMQSENQKLFKIGQAAAIANAVVDGWEAATSAWKWGMKTGGPVLAAAASAASLVRTGAMINSIASASPSGGSSGVSSSGGSSAISTPTTTEEAPQQVLIQGLESGMRLSPEELQEVFDQIYEENGRRGTIFKVAL